MKFFIILLGLFSISFQSNATEDMIGKLVADSVSEFSSVQGRNGWSYGYYDGDNKKRPFKPADFEIFSEYYSNGNCWASGVWGKGKNGCNGYRAFSIDRKGGNINMFSSDPRQIVRRWESTVSGIIEISGCTRGREKQKDNPIARVYHSSNPNVEEKEIYKSTVALNECKAFKPIKRAILQGEILDFVLLEQSTVLCGGSICSNGWQKGPTADFEIKITLVETNDDFLSAMKKD